MWTETCGLLEGKKNILSTENKPSQKTINNDNNDNNKKTTKHKNKERISALYFFNNYYLFYSFSLDYTTYYKVL